jgi:hypothetical protein
MRRRGSSATFTWIVPWDGLEDDDANGSRTLYQHGTKSTYFWCDFL